MGLFDELKRWSNRMDNDRKQYKGKLAEDGYSWSRSLQSYEIKRTGVGSDFKERKVDWMTGKKEPWTKVEVKSGNSTLTKRQREEKRNSKRYRVERNPIW